MNSGNMPYQRIISLVPSLTELIIDLGLKEMLVGRTRFCIHPENTVKDIPIIGGTKNPNTEKIIHLQPDLIIANKEENRREDILQLEKHFEIYLTDISTIDEALSTIINLGIKLSAEVKARKLVEQVEQNLTRTSYEKPISTAYFIWQNPWMSIGRDTYIHDVMKHWGLKNVFSAKTRYPKIKIQRLNDYHPELILLSSEPYPFREKHQKELQKHYPDIPVQLVDGEWFSWYGSGMLRSFEELNRWRREI